MMRKGLIFFFIAAIAWLASCKNNDEVFKTVTYAQVNIVNASADTVNFYLNGTRQNNGSSLFPGGSTLYLQEPSGLQAFQFKKAGTAPVLFSVPLAVKDSLYYSVYATSGTAAGAFSTIDSLTLDTPYSRVRFVQAAPDAGTLNVTIGDTAYFRARAYKTSSVFVSVGQGLKIVKVYRAGSSSPAITDTVMMYPNKGYTLFAKGLLNGTGNSAFKLGLVGNF